MWRHSASATFIAAMTLAMPACRFPGRDGPVPQALASCRHLSQQGAAALERGQPQQAEELLAKAVKSCPIDAEARSRYAEALWQGGSRQQAVDQLEEAAKLAPEDAALQVRLCEMHLAMGQIEAARRSAEKAIERSPRLAAAWAARARVMRAIGQPQQALADCHRALGYEPDNRQALAEAAELYRQTGQPQRALQTLQTLAETYPSGEEPQRVLHLMGMAHLALGRYDDAVESLALATTRESPNAEIFYRLGEAQWLAGRPAAAAGAAEQALTLQPTHALSRDLLHRVELAQQSQGPVRR